MIDQEENLEPTFENNENTPEEKKLIEDIEKVNSQIADLVELQDILKEQLIIMVSQRRQLE